MENFAPEKLTQSQILKLKDVLPCAADGVRINNHEERIRLLEDLNQRLSILILGNEGQPSIFSRLEDISCRLKKVEDFLQVHSNDIQDLSDTVFQTKMQRLFNSGSWKIFLVLFGVAAGVIGKYLWVVFLL